MFLAFSVLDLLASEEGLHSPKQPIFDHYFELFALLRMNQFQAENSVLAFHFWHHQYTQGILFSSKLKIQSVAKYCERNKQPGL